jgi:hypothetical protein
MHIEVMATSRNHIYDSKAETASLIESAGDKDLEGDPK